MGMFKMIGGCSEGMQQIVCLSDTEGPPVQSSSIQQLQNYQTYLRNTQLGPFELYADYVEENFLWAIDEIQRSPHLAGERFQHLVEPLRAYTRIKVPELKKMELEHKKSSVLPPFHRIYSTLR